MRIIFMASTWTAAALAIALFAVTAETRGDNEPHSKDKGSGGAGARSGGGGGKIGDGVKPDAGGAKPDAGGAKPDAGGAKPDAVSGKKPDAGGGAKLNKKRPGKAGWNSWTKNGWSRDGWNSKLNSQHKLHHHGYWNNGIWIAPLVIASNQPWVYLQPPKAIASGQKWLGVTHEPYDGGGAYITGVYEGSPAQAVGLEVGDVIESLDGVDATDLGKVIQASRGTVTLRVLSGRTGDLVQQQVNLVR